jgi:multidrug efflux pump subunit AcrA (membrane-fusion protein)
LTALDEVSISSEADGLVCRILHNRGDGVRAGDTLVELDREKADYNLAQRKAALDKALAQYGAPDPAHLPPIEQAPDVQKKARAELVQARLIATYAKAANPERALQWVRAQHMYQFKSTAYAALISCCAKTDDLSTARELSKCV